MPGNTAKHRLLHSSCVWCNRRMWHPDPTGPISDKFAGCWAQGSFEGSSGSYIFLKELTTRDFGQQCGKPRLWTDSSSAMQASKRIGPGSKLRHLEVCEFYVQGALQSKQIALGKVKGTVNCANFLTKHSKSGTEVRKAMPGLGMYEARDGEDVLSSSKKISVNQPWPSNMRGRPLRQLVLVGWKTKIAREEPPRPIVKMDNWSGASRHLLSWAKFRLWQGSPRTACPNTNGTHCSSWPESALVCWCGQSGSWQDSSSFSFELGTANWARGSRNGPWGAIAHRRSADHVAT